jgi:hypothetical protein
MTPLARLTQGTLAGLTILALAACSGGGGGGGQPPVPPKTIADTLTYTAPSGSGLLLLRDASSTSTRLVLNVVGPPSTALSGVAFFLSADQTKVTWANVGSDKVAEPSPAFFSNTLVKAKVSGDVLQAGVFQKGTTAPATTGASTVLAKVALDLKSNIPVGTTITLSAPAGKSVIMNPSTNPTVTTPIAFAVGTLKAE